jgi:hypothetical protein
MEGSNLPTPRSGNLPHFFSSFLRLQLGSKYEAPSTLAPWTLSEGDQAEAYSRWERRAFTGICEFRHRARHRRLISS